MKYIEIIKDQLPYVAQVPLYCDKAPGDGTVLYDLEVMWNSRHDFLTIGLGINGDYIVKGEKLVLNRPIKIYHPLAPTSLLVPRNRPGQRGEVNYKNIGDTVLLAIEGDGVDKL